MSVGRERLIELAHSEVTRRCKQEPILSSFLIGSVVQGNPFVGNSADIDLVIIHRDHIQQSREFIRLSQQVHLDILHYGALYFSKPRQLRTDPWLGPAIAEPGFLIDPEHFFERVQASVRGQFHRPDFVVRRAFGFLQLAHQHRSLIQISHRWQHHYLQAVMLGINALMTCFNGPAAGRAFFTAIRRVLKQHDDLATYRGVLQLCGLSDCADWPFDQYMLDLETSWDHVQAQENHSMLSRCRKEYIFGGMHGLLDLEEYQAAGWLLITTWEKVFARATEEGQPTKPCGPWLDVLRKTKLTQADSERRKDVLNRYLAHVETQLQTWARQHGV